MQVYIGTLTCLIKILWLNYHLPGPDQVLKGNKKKKDFFLISWHKPNAGNKTGVYKEIREIYEYWSV